MAPFPARKDYWGLGKPSIGNDGPLVNANVSEVAKRLFRKSYIPFTYRLVPTPAAATARPSLVNLAPPCYDDSIEDRSGRIKVLLNSTHIGWVSKELDFHGRFTMVGTEGDRSNVLIVHMLPGNGGQEFQMMVRIL